MSDVSVTGPAENRLAWRQTLAVARLEIWRNFLGLRALGLYLLAGLPVSSIALITFWMMVVRAPDTAPAAGEISQHFAGVYGLLFARVVIFFVCLLVFTRLFRAEIQERSLHYSFLAPVPREILVFGKFLAGFVAVSLVLCVAVAGCFVIAFLPLTLGSGSGGYAAFMLRGGGLGQLAGYLGVTLLGVLGYGAVFTAMGLFFRSPILPGAVIYFWEWANFLWPPLLKRISVIHYLQTLQPVSPPEQLLALLATPPSPWLAVPGLLLVSAALLALSAWRLRHFEIAYGEE